MSLTRSVANFVPVMHLESRVLGEARSAVGADKGLDAAMRPLVQL